MPNEPLPYLKKKKKTTLFGFAIYVFLFLVKETLNEEEEGASKKVIL